MTWKILEKLKTHWHQLTASKKIEGAQHSAWLLAILLAGMAEFFKPPLKVCISGIDAVPCCTKLYLFKRGYWAKWQRKNTLKKLVARSALGCFLNWSQSLSSKSNEAGLVDCTWLALRFRVQIQFMCNVRYMLAISKQQVRPFLISGRLSWHLASWINMACALDEFYTSRALVNFRALLPKAC